MRRTGWQAVREMSNSVVPYLVSQIEHDPLRELMFKIKPSMPAKISSMLPDPKAYARRRSAAAGLLPEAGTNAVRALQVLLEIAEAEGPEFTHNFIRAIGMLAPGTEYEDRARKVILRVVSEARSDRDSELRRMSYHFLGSFDGNEVVVALIDGLRERRMTGVCIESLVKIGTNALPELTKAAAHESGYVRPAGLALEKIESEIRELRLRDRIGVD